MVNVQRLFAKTNLKIPIYMVKAPPLRIFQQQGLFLLAFFGFWRFCIVLGGFLVVQ